MTELDYSLKKNDLRGITETLFSPTTKVKLSEMPQVNADAGNDSDELTLE